MRLVRAFSAVGSVLRLLLHRRSAPDLSSEDGRSVERYRRALLAGIASAAARAVNIVGLLVSLPITLKYLGVPRFSVWVTITSLTALLNFADFGIGNGLMSAVARSEARADKLSLRGYVSSAFLALAGLALVCVIAAVLVAPQLPWGWWLAVKPNQVAASELAEVMTALVICLAIGIPAAVVQNVRLALQLGYVASLWQLAASAAGLLALLCAVGLHLSLTWLVVASLATPNLILAISSVRFWVHQRPDTRPGLSAFNRKYARELLGSGSLFFVIQLAATVAFSSDPLVLAHVLGPEAVTEYSVVSRLFDGVVMITALFLTPLWPAYVDAYARNDIPWIKRTLVISLAGTAAVTSVVAALLVLFSRQIKDVWVGESVAYSLLLFGICGIWAVIRATGNALAMFLNGIGWIGFQAVVATIFAVAAVAGKIVVTRQIGIVGLPTALIAAYVLTTAVPYAIRLPAFLARMRQ